MHVMSIIITEEMQRIEMTSWLVSLYLITISSRSHSTPFTRMFAYWSTQSSSPQIAHPCTPTCWVEVTEGSGKCRSRCNIDTLAGLKLANRMTGISITKCAFTL